jgi:epoxyqueuosine reductase QueG
MDKEIRRVINGCVTQEGALSREGNLWREPIVGFVDAFNVGIQKLKDTVSVEHLLPQEILSDAKSIVCFFIPFTREVIESNRLGRLASKKWAEAYIRTNSLIANVSSELERFIESKGFKVGKIRQRIILIRKH